MNKIRIMIADDHPLVIDGLRACLAVYDHIDVVGDAQTGREAFQKAEQLQPDIVLMDINMPDLNGLDATELFKEKYPDIRLLILTMHDNPEYIFTAVSYGARGFVLKDVPTSEIVIAIEAIHRGGSYFSSVASDILLTQKEKPAIHLTAREQTVLLLLAKGHCNKHIARELDISVRTVETHRKHVKKKLQIGTTAGLTKYAIDHGLIK